MYGTCEKCHRPARCAKGKTGALLCAACSSLERVTASRKPAPRSWWCPKCGECDITRECDRNAKTQARALCASCGGQAWQRSELTGRLGERARQLDLMREASRRGADVRGAAPQLDLFGEPTRPRPAVADALRAG